MPISDDEFAALAQRVRALETTSGRIRSGLKSIIDLLAGLSNNGKIGGAKQFKAEKNRADRDI